MRGSVIRKTWLSNPALYAPPRHRRACSYDVFIPNPLGDDTFDLPAEAAAVFSEAERAVAQLNSVSDPALSSLSRLLLRTESIASSKVEGMQADIRSIARAEARRSLGRSISRQIAEILANVEAMRLGVDTVAANERFQISDLLEIHRALMSVSSLSGTAGQVRTRQNWVGGNDYNPCGAAYVPPPAEEVEGLLADLAGFCNSDRHPPLVQAAIAHAQFETIHPFDDGNGRTGRALLQILLRRRGLAPDFVPPVSIVLFQRRESYIRGLIDFRENRIGDWLTFLGECMMQAAQLALTYRALVTDLLEFWRQRLRGSDNPRADAAAWAILDTLPAYPVLTANDAAAATGRTPPRVRDGIAQLERAGVLMRTGTSKRYRSWEPQGLLELIAELEAGQLSRPEPDPAADSHRLL